MTGRTSSPGYHTDSTRSFGAVLMSLQKSIN
jgi:hypothetical protein